MHTTRSKYLLNDPDNKNNGQLNVRDHLIGLAMTNPDVQICPDVDAIVRKDVEHLRTLKRVLLVSGGGAGHEPMFAGFVGRKRLTAAVSGSYFASPSAGSIVKLVKQIARPDDQILFIQANYTGDRLNFGLAKEQLTLEGFTKVGWFVFGDDLSPFLNIEQQTQHNADQQQQQYLQRKRRGLAGITFIHTIAGVLSEQGKCLNEIEDYLHQVSQRIFTLSVSLSACDIPGHGKSFELNADQMELGLGVHGESGIKRISLRTSRETVQLLLGELIAHLQRNEMLDKYNARLALIINNLGGLIPLEMNILKKEIIEYIQQQQPPIKLERIYCGDMFTSFNMKGISLSLILVDDYLMRIMDDYDYDDHGGNRNNNPFNTIIINHDYVYESKHDIVTAAADGDELMSDQVKSPTHDDHHDQQANISHFCPPRLFERMLVNACHAIINHETILNKLDETVGDSDCGSTLATMAKLFVENIARNADDDSTPSQNQQAITFTTLSTILKQSTSIGGTSGAIYSILFTAAQNFIVLNANNNKYKVEVLDEHQANNNNNNSMLKMIEFWSDLIRECMMKISTYGGAQINDRSMIDGLHGIVLGLEQCYSLIKNGQQQHFILPDICRIITDSTWIQAKKTSTMKPNVGRAAYVNDELCQGMVDAGAYAVAVWCEAALQALID